MNVSGLAVRRILRALDAGPEDLVLVYDDIDMELGKVRTRLKGGAGGHNGVQSVIDALATEGIRRVKIGIGRPPHKAQVPDHVLTVFEPDEEETVTAAVSTAAARVLELVAKG
jgi:PTH1 family peptidyl-tRNA hydrolase